MPTKNQISANTRNARLSTGPATHDGKARSSRNAIRHGLRAHEAVLPEEDAGEFNKLIASLEAELQPSTPREAFLVREMASAEWRLRRALRIETGGFAWAVYRFNDNRTLPRPADRDLGNTVALGTAFFKAADGDPFTKLARYENSLRRAYYKALQTLEKLRSGGAVETPQPPLPNEPNSPPSRSADPPTEVIRNPVELAEPPAQLPPESSASPNLLKASKLSCILQSGGFGSWTPFWPCIAFTSPSPSRSTTSSRSSPWALPC